MRLDYSDKIAILFLLFLFSLLILIVRIFYIDFHKPKHSVSPIYKKQELAIRGEILSKDKFTIATSKKIYSVAIQKQYISPNKRNILINMLSIYTNKSKEYFQQKLDTNLSRVVLLIGISSKTAKNLEYLSTVLDMKKVFLSTAKGIRFGLEISEQPFKRVYNYKDTLEPVLGLYRKSNKYGLERFYNQALKAKQNGFIQGFRDLKNRIIIDKNTKIRRIINGDNLVLNIDLSIQRKIELMLDKYKKKLNAQEIIIGVMDSKTGKMLALASSNRYNPNFILSKDVNNMNISAIRYSFEPGSVFKPITLSLLLEHHKVNIFEVVNAHNGYYKPSWRKRAITDDERFKWLSVENAVVYSSNIVFSQIAQRLNEKEFYFGLKKFGFTKHSGIDLSAEIVGQMPSLNQFKYPIYKASVSYGYAIRANFIQLLKAYSVFNNNGFEVIPTITHSFGNIVIKKNPIKVLSPSTALTIKRILRKVVLKGTGVAGQVNGIYVGGKTGTAYIASNGGYGNFYDSSFFGFADDETHSYTIGVTVIKPTPKYFASQTAVPVFKEIVKILINNSYLVPNEKLNKQ